MRKLFLPLVFFSVLLATGNAQKTIAEHKLTRPLLDKDHPDRVFDQSEKLGLVIALNPNEKDVSGELKGLGFNFKNKLGNFLTGVADTADIIRLANHPDVKWIDALAPEPQMLNDQVHATQRITYVQSGINYPGLMGEGVTIGVGDGGDLGNHIDFGDRVTNLGNGTYSSFGQHQDHVSGIIAGDGNLNPKYRGIAPEAELITQKTSNINYNLASYYATYGMVLTNNSYGSSHNCSSNGSYNYISSLYDEYMTDYPEVMIVFAAGNSGGSTCSPYPKGYHTVLKYYQSAKNVLTVGNIGKNRVISGGSSRGPVLDGRIKPEILGVGSGVWSTGNNYNYFKTSGTSMASPSVVGTLALMIERYRQLNSGQNPKSGLMKAIACNTAEDLGTRHPDYIHGFGLINARRAIEAINDDLYDTDKVGNNGEKTFTVSTQTGTEQLKVLLYWNDLPAAAYATPALINNLDLQVITPSGQIIYPWVLDSDPLKVADMAQRGVDNLNNIEQVTIDNPAPGNYTIKVLGADVSQGQQEFFVSYDVITPELIITHPAGNEVFKKGETISIEWEASILNTETFNIDYTLNGSSWASLGTASASERQFDFVLPESLSTAAQVKVSTSSQTGMGEDFNILGSTAILSLEDNCDGEVGLSWSVDANALEYTVYQFDGNKMSPIAVTSNTSADVFVAMNQKHWFAVAPVFAGGLEGKKSSSSDLYVECLSLVLPVELSEFSGKIERSKNVIRWITNIEENTKEFILERSRDSRNWETVEIIKASGWSSVPQVYDVEDLLWFKDTYYRLKIIDFDGTFDYSEVIVLNRQDHLSPAGGISLYPIPAIDKITIQWDSEDSYTKGDIRVFDNLKRLLIKHPANDEMELQELNISDLVPGMYTIQKGRYIQKLIITNRSN